MVYTKPVNRLHESLAQLQSALKFYEKHAKEHAMGFLAVVKAFEVATEYAWKELKQRVEAEGVLDVLSPKDAIRQAARLGMITSAEDWLQFINIRNSSVHDYFSMSEKQCVDAIKRFLKAAHGIFS